MVLRLILTRQPIKGNSIENSGIIDNKFSYQKITE